MYGNTLIKIQLLKLGLGFIRKKPLNMHNQMYKYSKIMQKKKVTLSIN